MKINYYLLPIAFFLLILLSCKKEKLAPFVSQNYLEEFQTEKPQFFDLDTIIQKGIVGKHGTKILFYRELFDVKEGEEIQLELIELYDFKEILYRGIQTLTTDRKLLETSGVLKLVFTSNGKELKLAKGEQLKIHPPKGKMKKNDIFLSKKDSLKNITWNITNQRYYDTILYIGAGISESVTVSYDSLNNFRRGLEKRNIEEDEFIVNYYKNDFFILQQNTSKWINIDRFVEVKSKITFELIEDQEVFSGFNIYFNYKDLKSFIYELRLNNDLKFDGIPISGKTFITVVGEKKEGMFYDKIELKEILNNSKIKLNMKKTTKEELKKLLD